MHEPTHVYDSLALYCVANSCAGGQDGHCVEDQIWGKGADPDWPAQGCGERDIFLSAIKSSYTH